jgi:hypothetical protein
VEERDITDKVSSLLQKLDKLETRLARLERIVNKYFPFSIDTILKEKGYEIIKEGDFKSFDFSKDEVFFQNLKSYFFRRTIIDVFKLGEIDEDKLKTLEAKWGASVVDYLPLLEESKIIKKVGNKFKPNYAFDYSGVILEWFIAKSLKESFGLESKFAVKLKNLKSGGDIDVIARVGSNIVLMECKESPPNNIPVSELKSIVKRIESFKPDFFVFIVDTTLSIKRNIIDNISWIAKLSPENLKLGVYRFGENFFVINAKRDLIKNLEFVIRLIS